MLFSFIVKTNFIEHLSFYQNPVIRKNTINKNRPVVLLAQSSFGDETAHLGQEIFNLMLVSSPLVRKTSE